MSALSDRTTPFTADEHATWAAIVSRQKTTRAQQMVDFFCDAVTRLEFDRDTIPSLDEVNARLAS